MALFPLDSETEMWLITLLHCSNAAYRINGNGRWHVMTDCGQMASTFPQQQQPCNLLLIKDQSNCASWAHETRASSQGANRHLVCGFLG